eukprot:scaffold115778_cov23-Tisochrysis_lutea.AAC.1
MRWEQARTGMGKIRAVQPNHPRGGGGAQREARPSRKQPLHTYAGIRPRHPRSRARGFYNSCVHVRIRQ